MSSDNLEILSSKKLNHDFLTSDCNESNTWYNLIADIYCKSVALRGVKLNKNSIDYIFELCTKSSDDQTLIKASKVLKICFKDRSVVSLYRNEQDCILNKVKILMDRNENIQNIHNAFSIVFVNIALEMSEISQENLESIAKVYDLELDIQATQTVTEDEADGIYINEKLLELLEKAGDYLSLTQPIEEFFNNALVALINYTEETQLPAIFNTILALLERILKNDTIISPRLLKVIEDLTSNCEESNAAFSSVVLNILKLVVKNGQEISVSLLKILSSYINDLEDDDDGAKFETYLEILNLADSHQDLPEDVFQIMEIANASSDFKNSFQEDQKKISILKFILSTTSISSGVNFPKRTLKDMENFLKNLNLKSKDKLLSTKELVNVMIDVAFHLSKSYRNLSEELLENFQQYVNKTDCSDDNYTTQLHLLDVYENLLKNTFKLPPYCCELFGKDNGVIIARLLSSRYLSELNADGVLSRNLQKETPLVENSAHYFKASLISKSESSGKTESVSFPEIRQIRFKSVEILDVRNVRINEDKKNNLIHKLTEYFSPDKISQIIPSKEKENIGLDRYQLEQLVMNENLLNQNTSTDFSDVMMLLREFTLHYNLKIKDHFDTLNDLMKDSPSNSWQKCVNKLLVELKYKNKQCGQVKSMETILNEFKWKNVSVVNDELVKKIENDILTIKEKNLKSVKILPYEAKPISKWERAEILKFSKTIMSMKQNENQDFVIECLAVVKRAMQLEGDRIELRDAQLLSSLIVLKYNNTSMLMQMSTGEGKTTVLNILSICVMILGRAKQVYNFTSSPDLAKRDAKKNKKLFAMFDLSVSENSDKRGGYIDGPKKCYSSQIVYGEGSQFLFDTLRHEYSGLNTFG
jgi:hypothetical protein